MCARCRSRIELAPLQEIALRRLAQGEPWSLMSDRAGYYRDGKPDTSRLQRRLGLMPNSGEAVPQRTCTYKTAVTLAAALGLDPVDIGV